MFRAVSICVLLIAAASASQYEDLNNLIEYGESPFERFVVPYPYQEHNPVVVKPFYPEVVVPTVPATEVGYSKLGLFTKVATKAVSFAVGLVKKAVVFLLVNTPALILGTLAAFGVCKFTPICSKLSSVSLYEVPNELRSFATPERLAKASEFVKNAIRKYRSLQED